MINSDSTILTLAFNECCYGYFRSLFVVTVPLNHLIICTFTKGSHSTFCVLVYFDFILNSKKGTLAPVVPPLKRADAHCVVRGLRSTLVLNGHLRLSIDSQRVHIAVRTHVVFGNAMGELGCVTPTSTCKPPDTS